MGTRKHIRGKESQPGTDKNHSGHNPKKPGERAENRSNSRNNND